MNGEKEWPPEVLAWQAVRPVRWMVLAAVGGSYVIRSLDDSAQIVGSAAVPTDEARIVYDAFSFKVRPFVG